MKGYTEQEINNLLDAEFAWRRKELSTILAEIKGAEGIAQSALIRAGVPLLYAHWEGFVKNAADAYVSYVGRRKLRYSELCAGLRALALQARLGAFAENENIAEAMEFVEFVSGKMETNARLPRLGVIKTGSNLNSKRLKIIVLTLGLDYSAFELKEKMIDDQLLRLRNNIAHGKLDCPDEEHFGDLYDEISSLLRIFKDQVSNAVTLKAYRQLPPV